MEQGTTPADDGFSMPPEWGPHSGCLVSWPCNEGTWSGFAKEAKKEYVEVINAVNEFEQVIVLSDPSTLREAREAVGRSIPILEIPLNDSWIRDNGPIFITSSRGEFAIAQFGFNGWGGRFPPYDRDAKVPEILSQKMKSRRYVAPMVLEGGAICVDGEGTLLTTESCLLNPNRNPGLSKEQVEDLLKSHLGVKKILWLKQGIHKSMIDGHIDGVAAFVRPSTVVLAATDDERDPNHGILSDSRSLLESSSDARGRSIEVVDFPMPRRREINGNRIAPCYTNFFIARGGIVAPTFGEADDRTAIETLGGLFPNHEVVGVRSEHIGVGGGEVHCITQQVPKTADKALSFLIEDFCSR
ncbi:MAG: agmatine deiminase family protein [Candidatus Thermoplasmatota archaeon]|nr:agmatine deiminase family protein [Candidatus Thermoplasmatota archaeon]